jgi:hypothetical protein
MKKAMILLVIAIGASSSLIAQKYFTKEGNITFHAGTKLEDIDATNSGATCIIDSQTGDMEWSVLVKGFKFKRALMEEHFNENYMESNTYPKSTFKGKIENISKVQFTTDGSYPVKIAGKLTMHGQTKDIKVDGTINVKGGKIMADSKFFINPADYKIEVPSTVQDKISNNVEVVVQANLSELKK